MSVEKSLSDFVEQISDDFESTFSVVDDNTLANMMSASEIDRVTQIIRSYIGSVELEFVKSGHFDDPYDIYVIRKVNKGLANDQ